MELFAYVSLHTRMCRRQEFYLHNNANGKLSACISITRVQPNLTINNKCSKCRCFSCETVLLTSQVLVYVLPGKMSIARVHGNYKYMRDRNSVLLLLFLFCLSNCNNLNVFTMTWRQCPTSKVEALACRKVIWIFEMKTLKKLRENCKPVFSDHHTVGDEPTLIIGEKQLCS